MAVNLKHIENPDADEIGNNAHEFLQWLGEPSSIFLPGADTSRTRAVVTLLHGNEPSGVHAIFRWLKLKRKPAVNVICIIASVPAATTEPFFHLRTPLNKRDLNRCFNGPFDDDQGELAKAILNQLAVYAPEAVVDIHNTSGSGPSFAVATYLDQQHDALCSLFTQRMVVTHLRLGALMEISETLCPTITIECGGRLDEQAHETAWNGLNRYFLKNDVMSLPDTDFELDILEHPARLEIRSHCHFNYAEHLSSGVDLALRTDIERFNGGVTPAGSVLGLTRATDANDLFVARNTVDNSIVNDIVTVSSGKLVTARDLKLFMITNNPDIARSDCLFYAVVSDD